jgi:hypothetical protein
LDSFITISARRAHAIIQPRGLFYGQASLHLTTRFNDDIFTSDRRDWTTRPVGLSHYGPTHVPQAYLGSFDEREY